LPLAEGLKASVKLRKLAPEAWAAEDVAWTAGGREVIFSANLLGSVGLWRIAVSGAAQPQPLTVGENSSYIAISPQRARLVYSREVEDTNIWSIEVSGLHDKPAPFNSTQVESNPQISPDGKKVAFSSSRSGSYEIWTCDFDGSNPLQLTSFGKGQTASPRWSPDSRWVSFDSNSIEGQFDVYIVDADGGQPQRLTSHPAQDSVSSWSRDGRWIYFGSNRSGSHQVWKMPRSGGDALQITKKGGWVPLESLDGKFVYYTKSFDDRRIWRIPSQGGEETEVLGPIFRRNFDVSKDGIYFMSQPDSSKKHFIRFFSFATREIKDITSIENPGANYISVSPDGRWILYPKIDQEGSDLMLVENFR
jgi:Tol biopolymer transport system component